MGVAQTRKGPATYNADKAWCGRWLARGRDVWCIRRRESGLVVAYVAEDIKGLAEFEQLPVTEFTVQRMVMREGAAWFGPETEWPR